jgi:hypothetical protein
MFLWGNGNYIYINRHLCPSSVLEPVCLFLGIDFHEQRIKSYQKRERDIEKSTAGLIKTAVSKRMQRYLKYAVAAGY